MQSKLQNKPITDLAKAIGINDKFLFIKELFGGDSDLYNQTIKHLNHFTDLNEAIIYLQENFTGTQPMRLPLYLLTWFEENYRNNFASCQNSL